MCLCATQQVVDIWGVQVLSWVRLHDIAGTASGVQMLLTAALLAGDMHDCVQRVRGSGSQRDGSGSQPRGC
jgi:hypothetical protein